MGEFKTWLIKFPNIFFLLQELFSGILQTKHNNYNGVKMKLKHYSYASDVLHLYIYYMYKKGFKNNITMKVNSFVDAIFIYEIIIIQ